MLLFAFRDFEDTHNDDTAETTAMAGRSCERRPGTRHPNPKPPPTKKPARVPGEGRFQSVDDYQYLARLFAWKYRRSVKIMPYPFSPELIAMAYMGMPARVYRHNQKTGGTSELEMLRALAQNSGQ